MSQILLTPFTERSKARSLGSNLFRKQVLPFATINYQGREITFDKQYAKNLVHAYSEQAYDAVPFVMADEQNRHTMDPERTRGEITGLEVEDDGLYAYIKPSTKEAADFLRTHPKMGVSVRVVEEMTRADGRSWPVALQHVLGTFDPQLTGMSPWKEVKGIEASSTNEEVLDLSGLNFTTTKGDQMGSKTEYSDDELLDLFQQFLTAQARTRTTRTTRLTTSLTPTTRLTTSLTPTTRTTTRLTRRTPTTRTTPTTTFSLRPTSTS